MAEEKTDQKTGPANAKPAGGTRAYTVLRRSPVDGNDWTQVDVVEAKDEKEARWAVVDKHPELKEACRSANPPELVAVSDRNWTPKVTREEVVEQTKRS